MSCLDVAGLFERSVQGYTTTSSSVVVTSLLSRASTQEGSLVKSTAEHSNERCYLYSIDQPTRMRSNTMKKKTTKERGVEILPAFLDMGILPP